ncbi:hypothetical protein [Nocardia cyriacigeorgica]|nr:hypothetical protein [Nocardia cyriacigeorgica]
MVKILAELPKTQTGKIRRGALRDQHMTPEPQGKGNVNESL